MWSQLVNPIASLLDKFIPDKSARDAMAHEIATMAEKTAHDAAMAQVELNKAEAQHRTLFVAGWRPHVGWVCGFALSWNCVLQPMIAFGVTVYGVEIDINTLPKLDTSMLMPVLLGMLGLGGMRSWEKSKGVTK